MKRYRLLLVEDNAADVSLLEEALQEQGVLYELTLAQDGEAACELLDALDCQEDCPDLIVLDLNLPKRNGMQVLATIRQHPYGTAIPVVVITGSDAPRDVANAERYGAHYLQKPRDYDGYLALGSTLRQLLPPD